MLTVSRDGNQRVFFHLPKMGCTLPSLLAAEMTLMRARRGAKICTSSSSSMRLYLISSSIVAKGQEGSSRKDSSSSPKSSLHCLCPVCTHGKHCARRDGATICHAHCYERFHSAFCAGETNLFPLETAKTSSLLPSPLVLCAGAGRAQLSKAVSCA